MTTMIQPTRQARRVHLSHLATTHRAPLVARPETGAAATSARAATGGRATRTRAAAFTPMTRDPLTAPTPRPQFQHHEA
ncbi:hypothetical protein [Terrabacter sp. C0L_2]|uniref:hypothetical protein n=1 Tax=Terrabacter sp. C0L_2 TaxID=3108389 RepID=UPI002ED537F9|nr:hypothetical protein U5C87_08680 [Terrabacter sp. C0L_2]